MDSSIVIRTLRHQAWDRAKGELNSMMGTFWHGETGKCYEELDKAIKDFIKAVEDENLLY